VIRRLLLPAILGLAFYFALFGGQYSVFERRSIQRAIQEDGAALAALRAETDSLRLRADSLELDPAALERLAREQYGLVREGEILYRFTDPGDSLEAGAGGGADVRP